jgi:Na+/proline symporter
VIIVERIDLGALSEQEAGDLHRAGETHRPLSVAALGRDQGWLARDKLPHRWATSTPPSSPSALRSPMTSPVHCAAPRRAPLSERALMVTSQTVMAIVTLVSAAIACMPLPALFTIGLFAIQIMVQLSVPLYLGIFTKWGNSRGAIAGMLAGVATVCVLQITWLLGIPWAFGLTTGAVGPSVNPAIFLLAHL